MSLTGPARRWLPDSFYATKTTVCPLARKPTLLIAAAAVFAALFFFFYETGTTLETETIIADTKLDGYMDKFNSPYGTHTHCLVELIKHTTGNIIELGCGYSSTVLIRDLIKNTDRKLVSLESNLEWLNKFKHLEDDNHKLFYVDAENVDNDATGEYWIDFIRNNTLISSLDFEVCFIDQSPWTARTHALNYFKDICPFIIVHDVDYFPVHNKWGKAVQIPAPRGLNVYNMDFSDILKQYMVYYPPFEYFAGPTGPPTLLCSNILTDVEFNKMCDNIDYEKYYNHIQQHRGRRR